jgi:hypothetical protein
MSHFLPSLARASIARAQEVAGYFQSFLAIRGDKASLRNDIPDEI